MRRGTTFELTEITPTPPAAMIGRVRTSSPEQTAKPGSAAGDDLDHLLRASRSPP